MRPLSVIRSNFTDACAIVELCAREGRWLLHFSTSEVYGRTLASYVSPGTYDDASLFEQDEDSTPLITGPVHNQRWTYAAAKQLLERLIYAYSREDGLPFTIVRPFNFFGPAHGLHPRPRWFGASSHPRVVHGCAPRRGADSCRGSRCISRTIVSIHDAVDAVMLMLAQRRESGEPDLQRGQSRERDNCARACRSDASNLCPDHW